MEVVMLSACTLGFLSYAIFGLPEAVYDEVGIKVKACFSSVVLERVIDAGVLLWCVCGGCDGISEDELR